MFMVFDFGKPWSGNPYCRSVTLRKSPNPKSHGQPEKTAKTKILSSAVTPNAPAGFGGIR
jgi:hypothetical protein